MDSTTRNRTRLLRNPWHWATQRITFHQRGPFAQIDAVSYVRFAHAVAVLRQKRQRAGKEVSILSTVAHRGSLGRAKAEGQDVSLRPPRPRGARRSTQVGSRMSLLIRRSIFSALAILNGQAKTLLAYDQAEATPGVLPCAFCGKSNVNTSGSVPVFSISTPPFASAACVMNPISG